MNNETARIYVANKNENGRGRRKKWKKKKFTRNVKIKLDFILCPKMRNISVDTHCKRGATHFLAPADEN